MRRMSNDAPFIRPVPQQFPGTALSGAQTQLLGSLSFPAAGGVQAVDALGAVLPLSSATGSLIPAADGADDLGDVLTPLRWANGYFSGTVMAATLSAYVAGVPNIAAPVAKLSNSGAAVNYLNLTNAATGVAPVLSVVGANTDINLGLAAKGAGSIASVSPVDITPPVVAAGGLVTPHAALTVNPAGDTGMLASTEAPSVFFNLIATREFDTGALGLQREVLIKAPTYAFVAPSTITDAATFGIEGPPTAGANCTITNPYSFFVTAGASWFGGAVLLGGALSAGGAFTMGANDINNIGIATVQRITGAVDNLLLQPVGAGGINLRNAGNTITVFGVQAVSAASSGVAAENVQNTTGNAQTIDAVSGSFRILTAGAATTFVISNNRVLSADSVVVCTFKRIDATATVISALAAAGQFTVTINAAASADTDVSFMVINAAT